VDVSGGPGSTGALQDVTLAGTLNVNGWNVDVAGSGLTLANGTINIGGRDLNFSGTQTLGVSPGDNGTVSMTSNSGGIQVTSSTGLLTIAPGITISADGGTITSGTANLDNQGTIDCTGNEGLTVEGNWSNDGVVEATSGTLTLAGTWTNNADGKIVDTASITNFTGIWNNEGTITSSGAATVGGGVTSPSPTWAHTRATPMATIPTTSKAR
jgi:hypothetical protein